MKLVMKIYCTKGECNKEVNSCIWGGNACKYAKFEEVDA